MFKIVYLIQCDRMRRADRIECLDIPDFLKTLERYMQTCGPIVLLYQEEQIR